jgi:hypothetical protein
LDIHRFFDPYSSLSLEFGGGERNDDEYRYVSGSYSCWMELEDTQRRVNRERESYFATRIFCPTLDYKIGKEAPKDGNRGLEL